jgi:hypothetical protein
MWSPCAGSGVTTVLNALGQQTQRCWLLIGVQLPAPILKSTRIPSLSWPLQKTRMGCTRHSVYFCRGSSQCQCSLWDKRCSCGHHFRFDSAQQNSANMRIAHCLADSMLMDRFGTPKRFHSCPGRYPGSMLRTKSLLFFLGSCQLRRTRMPHCRDLLGSDQIHTQYMHSPSSLCHKIRPRTSCTCKPSRCKM